MEHGPVLGELAVAYYDYGNVKNDPTLYNQTTGFGNATYIDSALGRTFYKYDYNLLNVMANVKCKLVNVEPMVLFDFVTNGAAKTDPAYNKKLNTSWLLGAAAKFSKLPVDWDLAYNYRVQQKDATLAAFAESDPGGGGTNYQGHKVALGVGVLHNTRLVATYMHDTKDPENSNTNKRLGYDRFQADLEVKF